MSIIPTFEHYSHFWALFTLLIIIYTFDQYLHFWALFTLLSIIHTFEHYSHFWALFTRLSINHTFEHFSHFWALFTLLSIFHTFEHFSHFWAFFTLLSINHTFEHYTHFWALVTHLSIIHTFEHYSHFFFTHTCQKVSKRRDNGNKCEKNLNFLIKQNPLVYYVWIYAHYTLGISDCYINLIFTYQCTVTNIMQTINWLWNHSLSAINMEVLWKKEIHKTNTIVSKFLFPPKTISCVSKV